LRRLIIVTGLAIIGWQGYTQYQRYQTMHADGQVASDSTAPAERREHTPSTPFRCDGRTHCSQMTSCEEATFFLRNCPGSSMDGDNDGIPCERQWCG
jgi:hypothetical protein